MTGPGIERVGVGEMFDMHQRVIGEEIFASGVLAGYLLFFHTFILYSSKGNSERMLSHSIRKSAAPTGGG